MKKINDLESYWMPFTANRDFKKEPRIVCSAEGMYYKSLEGKDILDAGCKAWNSLTREVIKNISKNFIANSCI